MAEKKKINWLLILQGWAMLWVVIGHSFLGVAGEGPEWENALYHTAYSFHMPLFMLVSGWLFYLTRLADKNTPPRWPYCKIIKDKAVRLLLPGLVFSIVALALKVAFPGEMTRQVDLSLPGIAHSYLYPNDNPMRELWFIITLFWFFLLTPFWRWALEKKWTMWLVLVALVVIHFAHPSVELLCIGRVFNFALWFFLGLVVCKEEYVDKFMTKQPWLTLVIGVAVYGTSFLVQGTIGVFLATVGGIVASFGLALIADKYLPKLFFSFRNYTYQIFLMGIFAQMFVKIVYRHISMPYVAGFVICLLAGLYVPVVVSKVIEKMNWKPLKLCVGLK